MGKCLEQLDRYSRDSGGARSGRRWIKLQMNRAERRRAKHDGENAPKRRRCVGWER
jgi:hypothetical protein